MTASTRDGEEETFYADVDWQSGVVAGGLAAVAMGLVIMVLDADVMRETIAGLYGMEGNLLFGWIAHVVHGVIFGLVFAFVLVDPALHPVRTRYTYVVVLGTVYGVLLAAVASGIVMPIWLSALGFDGAPPIPFITAPSILWHVVYGTILGAIFGELADI